MAHASAVVLAALSGAAFSCIALSYRIGQSRGVAAANICMVGTLAAGLVFAGQWGAAGSVPDGRVFFWALLAGFGQYATVLLLWIAMKRGPLAPAWCAVNLGLLSAVAWSALFLGETLTPRRLGALAAAAGCIALASAGQGQARRAGRDGTPALPATWQSRALYGLILIAIVCTNGLSPIGMKVLSAPRAGPTLLETGRSAYLALFYLAISASLAVELALGGRAWSPTRPTLALALLMAAGSMTGLTLMAIVSRQAAADVFPVIGITSILFGALITVAGFRERLSRLTAVALGLGVVAVGLAGA